MWINGRLHLIAAALTSLLSAPIFAAPVAFNIDPARSTLVLSGTYTGNQLETWSVGSTDDPIVHDGFTTPYFGTIAVDRDVAAGTLQIRGGDIAAQNFPGWSASPPSTSPSPFNYSFFTQLSSDFSASSSFEGAIRNFSFSLSGPVAPDSTSFDVSQLTGKITAGRLDWAVLLYRPLVFPHESEVDDTSPLPSDLVLAPGLATLVESAGEETLSIPLSTDFLVMTGSDPTMFHLSGTIVATHAVPEPSTIASFFAGCMVLLPRHRRRSGYNRGQ